MQENKYRITASIEAFKWRSREYTFAILKPLSWQLSLFSHGLLDIFMASGLSAKFSGVHQLVEIKDCNIKDVRIRLLRLFVKIMYVYTSL